MAPSHPTPAPRRSPSDPAIRRSQALNLDALLNAETLHGEIDGLMTEKLQELTPEKVKELMEDVIRTHLGWLVVWGNVFGSLIGLASVALGYP